MQRRPTLPAHPTPGTQQPPAHPAQPSPPTQSPSDRNAVAQLTGVETAMAPNTVNPETNDPKNEQFEKGERSDTGEPNLRPQKTQNLKSGTVEQTEPMVNQRGERQFPLNC